MKYFILIIFLNMTFSSNSQTYSKVISDNEIINFINLDIQRDSIKGKKTIRREMYKLYEDAFFYKDSADLREIIYHLDTFFSRQDIDFFLEQIKKSKKRNTWKKAFINSTLVDNVELDSNNRVESVMYSYSLPLFSFDKRKVIIIKGFFCGLVCGGGATYIYERTNTNEWQLIKKLNEWAE